MMSELAERAFLDVLEAANDAVLGIDAVGKIEFVNHEAAACFGYSREELLGQNMEILIPNRFREAHRRNVFRYGVRPETRMMSDRAELRALKRDGSEIPVRITLKPIEVDGSPLVFAFVKDMRERKEAKKSSHLLEVFFQYTLTQIAFLDRDFNFLRVNDTFAKARGREVSEFPGRNYFDLYPSDAQPTFEEVVGKRKPHQAFARPLEYAHAPDRGVTYWNWTLVPILDETGEVEMLVLSLNDVTERVRAIEALRRNEQRLRHTQKMEAMGRLAGGISHDFNNMLTSIGGNAAILEKTLATLPGLPVEARESLRSIRHSTDRAARLTRRLLAFSRRDAAPTDTLIDLDRLVAEMRNMIRPLVRESVELRVLPATGLPPIRVDAARIEQIVMNLVINASDAMPEGGTLTIETGYDVVEEDDTGGTDGACRGPHVALTIRDTGSGMDEETLRHIYEPFFTTKPLGEGTGLGLAVVQEEVSRIGGHVRVSSVLGEGTSFRILFPADGGTQAGGAQAESVPEPPWAAD